MRRAGKSLGSGPAHANTNLSEECTWRLLLAENPHKHTHLQTVPIFSWERTFCSELQEAFTSIISSNLYMFQGRYFYSFLLHEFVHQSSETEVLTPDVKSVSGRAVIQTNIP